VELDEWIVMPNHVHGIIVINDANHDIDRTDAPNEIQGRGVQLNAPASQIAAKSAALDGTHRTGVQLNAPTRTIDHTSQLDVATDKNIDAGAFHRTGVQLNAPAPHIIASNAECEDRLDHPDEYTDIGDPRGTGVQLNAPASQSGALNDHAGDTIDR